MKLYDAMTPNTLRVKAFLAEKGIDIPRVRLKVLEGETRTTEFLAINPMGEVPVLETDDGEIITETVAICRYLEALHPEPSLFGRTALEQGRIEMWNRRVELHLFGPIGDYGRHTIPFFADKCEQVPAYAETLKRKAAKTWAFLDDQLADGHPFIAGDAISVADLTAMAAFFVSDVTGVELSSEQAHAKAWEQRLRARPSFADQFAEAA